MTEPKTPCWTCHKCGDWNQPDNTSCLEVGCGHERCDDCITEHDPTAGIRKIFPSRIPIRNIRALKSRKQVPISPQSHSANAKAKHQNRTAPRIPIRDSRSFESAATSLPCQIQSTWKRPLRAERRRLAPWVDDKSERFEEVVRGVLGQNCQYKRHISLDGPCA